MCSRNMSYSFFFVLDIFFVVESSCWQTFLKDLLPISTLSIRHKDIKHYIETSKTKTMISASILKISRVYCLPVLTFNDMFGNPGQYSEMGNLAQAMPWFKASLRLIP
jgi:hypothetical protein